MILDTSLCTCTCRWGRLHVHVHVFLGLGKSLNARTFVRLLEAKFLPSKLRSFAATPTLMFARTLVQCKRVVNNLGVLQKS